MSAKKIRARKVWISDEIPGETVNNPDVTMCRIEMVPQLGDELYYLLHAASYDAMVEQVAQGIRAGNEFAPPADWRFLDKELKRTYYRQAEAALASLGLTRPKTPKS